MQSRTKDIIVTFGFVMILILVFVLNILIEDKKISLTERRTLASFPKINLDTIFKTETMNNFENYAMDQFMLRDNFRSIKTFVSMNVFQKKDNNKMFEKDGAIYKIEYPLNESNVVKSCERLNYIYDKYLNNMNVYYAIIPDKNYYLKDNEYLKMDYNRFKEIVNNNLKNMNYIDIWNQINLEDYYKTDIHWKQENLIDVLNKIREDMNLKQYNSNYDIINEGEFYGVYYGQFGKTVVADNLKILNNEVIENCIVYDVEKDEYSKIYNYKKTSDKYDIYLHGSKPIITIINPNVKEDKELLLFRDSFGSSLAPLLVENYSKITLIDIRYISSNVLNEYINFNNQDVLFLYSTLVLNQNILK